MAHEWRMELPYILDVGMDGNLKQLDGSRARNKLRQSGGLEGEPSTSHLPARGLGRHAPRVSCPFPPALFGALRSRNGGNVAHRAFCSMCIV